MVSKEAMEDLSKLIAKIANRTEVVKQNDLYCLALHVKQLQLEVIALGRQLEKEPHS